MSTKMKDLTGQRFGNLTIIKFCKRKQAKNGKYQYYWLFKCDCSNEKVIRITSVKFGNTKSCGCFKKQNPSQLTHGMWSTNFYAIWASMKARCNNKNGIDYHNYGGRGIKVLWKNFEEFKADMYKSYLKHKKNNSYTSINRTDNDGNYCKENCKWATRLEQNNNKRSNINNPL